MLALVALVAQGRDPAAERARRKGAPTVTELAPASLDLVRAKRKATTAAEYARLMDRHVLPALGRKRIAEVMRADVSALHRKLRATPYQANRVLALCGAFFERAERHDYRPAHVHTVRHVEPYPERKGDRYLTADEFIRLGATLDQAERDGLPPAPDRRRVPVEGPTAKHRPRSAGMPIPANPYAAACLRFLLLSGWREGEARTLRWDALDLARGFAVLADPKTGRSARPLGAPAVDLLDGLPRLAGSPYVFPKVLAGIGRVWDTVTSRSIPIRLRRATKDELRGLAKIRGDRIGDECRPLRQQVLRWKEALKDALPVADPVVPDVLGARQADVWRPLLAIADAAGGEWPARARAAAAVLHGAADEEGDIGLLLPEDVREILRQDTGESMVTSAHRVERLTAMAERPWPEYRHGQPLTARGLATLLRRFEIAPENARIGVHVRKGHPRNKLYAACVRYLPVPSETSATSATSAPSSGVAPVAATPEDRGGPRFPSAARRAATATTATHRSTGPAAGCVGRRPGWLHERRPRTLDRRRVAAVFFSEHARGPATYATVTLVLGERRYF